LGRVGVFLRVGLGGWVGWIGMDGGGLVRMGSVTVVLTAFSFFWFGLLSPKVQLRLGTLRLARHSAFEEDAYSTCPVNAIPSHTPSAADAVIGLSIVNTKLVASAATLALSYARTSGARRLSEERLPVLEGCDTLRRYRGDSRTGSGRTPRQRRGRLNRRSRNDSLNFWHCIASSLRCNHANMLFVLCEKLHALHFDPLVTCTDCRLLLLRISRIRTSILPAVEEASCY